jgi:hypothetical protein
VGVQVIWDGGGTERAGEYTFFYGKGNENYELGTSLFIHKSIISAVKSVQFVTDIIVLNIHAPTEDKIDDIKDMFYEELEQVFGKFPKYHINIC